MNHKIALDNLGLAKWFAIDYKKKSVPAYIEFEDILGYAYVGLFEASKTFKGKDSKQFKAYARKRMYGTIVDGIFGAAKNRNIFKENYFTHHPLDGMEEGFEGLQQQSVSKQDMYVDELISILSELMSGKTLTANESKVLNERYFLDRSNSELSSEMGITTSRISQIHKNAVAKLKMALSKKEITSIYV